MTNLLAAAMIVTAYSSHKHHATPLWPVIDGVTCAAPRSIPKGTRLLIDGVGERIVTDRYALWLLPRVDLFFGTNREAAVQWGKQRLKVWIIKQ